MLPALFLALQALALTSASVVKVRQNGGDAVASNIPTGDTFAEPARGEGRRVLVWGRPDLALTVLGEPNAGTAVGIAYTLDLSDANSGRQIFDINLKDGRDNDDDDDDDDDDDINDEPDQFDYNDDDDEIRLRGTQLCVTMSTTGNLTLENCTDDRDDDDTWIQDWEFDDDQDTNRQWTRIEDDDDDNRCLAASFDSWSDDEAQLTVETCNNGNANQRFYQVLPGASPSAAPSGSASSTSGGGSSQTSSSSGTATSSPASSVTSAAPGQTSTPNASRPQANMWGRGIFKMLANL